MNYIRLARSYPNYLGYGMLHYFFSCMGQTFLISTFVPYFVDSLSVTNSSFSLIYGFATISSAFVLPQAGKLIDRFRLRNISLMVGVGLSLACLLTSFASNTIILFFGLLCLRFFGQGMMVLIGSTSIARYFDLTRGKALSLSSMGLPIAESFMPVIIIYLIHGFGWPATWQILGLATFVIFVPTAIMLVKSNNPFQYVPEEKKPSKTDVHVRQDASRKEVLRDWRFYMLLPGLIFLPLFITGMFIHQNLLADANGWTMQWMASCFVGFGIARISTNFIAGSLIDRFSSRNVFIFYLLPIALGLGVLLLGQHPWLAMMYMILAGITASLSGLTSASLWAEIYGVRHLGAIKSMTATLMILASALGPLIIGFGLENSPDATLVVSILIIALITAMSWIGIRATDRQRKMAV
ncbi:MFS transporter [Catalinimonas niigatensis]|uniref:MFS transporter n=1 Tax=Catalinimonas niigatensis TaxID=1397264 RepID=UPI002666CE1E|nr:MFS transporter [Catalinimonas niigatensis]WPP50357.1 MFS transporter [Catalinimonas niigatensis]